ncbi:restriction endonuclease subunit S [Rhodanobacter sp. T12-5]|uniref:restriction endonuclease subunit S n=1 Tax=Rhodanobacter sp. T12-5 TaxID=2024611 RepID=UPI0018D620C1|nr:restriction endonuclease subunit S [Rhodanobacter sp. T12-5]
MPNLSEVAEINPRLDRSLIDDMSESVSFVPMANVSELLGAITSEEDRKISDVIKGFTTFQDRDVLVAKITPCFENGKIAHARIGRRLGFGSTEFHVVRPKASRLNDRYLYHFLRQPVVREDGERRMTGSAGQKRVPKAFLEALEIPLPPLAEQRRIAAILDKADALRAKRREAITKLDQLLQSVFLEMFGDPETNPKRWPIGVIGDLLESVKYGSSEKAALEGDVPILRMNNLTYAGEIDLTHLKYISEEKAEEKHQVRSGDILFNRTNSKELVGKTAVYAGPTPMAYAGYLVRGRTRRGQSPEYISGFLNSSYGKTTLQGMCKSIVGMANINAREFAAIAIPLPPSDLQKTFQSQVSCIRSRRDMLKRQSDLFGHLFASLQHRAFAGTL